MDVSIHTSDPEHVDPVKVKEALELGGFFVISVDINDGERGWAMDDPEPGAEPEPARPSVPDFEVNLVGEYQGNPFPERADYRVRAVTQPDGIVHMLTVESSDGQLVGVTGLGEPEVDGILKVAETDHDLTVYDGDWTFPSGMVRAVEWILPTEIDHYVVLRQPEIDSLAEWLRYATGDKTWNWAEQGSEWTF